MQFPKSQVMRNALTSAEKKPRPNSKEAFFNKAIYNLANFDFNMP